jgi:eukaryotic-like serine/threonine-protein kinase
VIESQAPVSNKKPKQVHEPPEVIATPPRLNVEEPPPSDPATSFATSEQTNQHIPITTGGLQSGQAFGPYRIVSLLGVGGMGEVYLARDSRLPRQVALKLLPARLMQDDERVRRFKREALAVSALNHPNVLTIFEIGQARGVVYIATEFVDGRTLRQRYDHGTLALKEALDVAMQVASGLAAAHASGVVHRDIKPENIMLRQDGYAKILDFGIAKLVEPRGSPSDDTMQYSAGQYQTSPGIIIGTVAYMSPEQALGMEIDHRSDIFSLGVLLYEMLTGKRPFSGSPALAPYQSLAQRLPAQLSTKTAREQAELVAELDRVLSRAVERDRELRFQTMADFRAELRRLQREVDSSFSLSSGTSATLLNAEVEAAKSVWWKTPLRLGAASVLGLALLLAAWFAGARFGGGASQPFKNRTFLQLTFQDGEEIFPSLSPDGKQLLYASRAEGNSEIYLQRVGGAQALNLTKDAADDTQPAFSPNGDLIVLRSERNGGGLFVMGGTGESIRRLTDFGFNPAWSPDGKEVVFCAESIEIPGKRFNVNSPLWAVNVTTNEKRLVVRGDAAQPNWSPHGQRIAYWSLRKGGQRDLMTVAATGGEPSLITDDAAVDWNPVWSPDGRYLYFLSDRSGVMNLWRVPMDEASGKTTGVPEAVITPAQYVRHISFSRDGKRLAYAQTVARDNLQRVGFDPARGQVVGAPTGVTQGSRPAVYPDLSPDGEWLAFSTMGARQEDIFVIRKDGAEQRQLTDDAHRDRHPRWSPDGKQVVFFSTRSGKYEVWRVNADGSEITQLTDVPAGIVLYPLWSPDGTRLAYTLQQQGAFTLATGKPMKGQTPQPLPKLAEPGRWFWACAWSPDGKRLAGWQQHTETALSGIVLYSFDKQSYEQITEFGVEPVWLNDNRRLLFNHQGKLWLLDSATKEQRELLALAPHQIGASVLAKDNRTLYFVLTTTESDIWLMNLE